MQWQWESEARDILGQADEPAPAPPGIVVEPSHCPACGHRLAFWENLPLLSFLLLRGRCRACGKPISLQYPLVELLTGLLFACVVWRFGAGPQALAALAFTGVLIAAAGIDLRTTLLPDSLTLPLLWLGLLLSLDTVFVSPQQAILGAALGYLSLWSVYWGFRLLTGKEGMGHGDFKLLAALGAWCGAGSLVSIILLSSICGAVIGSLWLALRGRDRATPIPFGPYLAVAGWLELVFRIDLPGLYLRWLGG
ncbi:MAG: type 4 prepilin-like proteins leader peptide-processing enzyme [Lysobacteraceae bacterium]|nr:MAG: type 4 prepilin-like proteins leader peptide-processing enzyme [Xanthomonadaceae bacterium]